MLKQTIQPATRIKEENIVVKNKKSVATQIEEKHLEVNRRVSQHSRNKKELNFVATFQNSFVT